MSRIFAFDHLCIASFAARKRQGVIERERVSANGCNDSRALRGSRKWIACGCGSDGVESSGETEDLSVSLGFRESVAVRVLFNVEASKALIRTRKFL